MRTIWIGDRNEGEAQPATTPMPYRGPTEKRPGTDGDELVAQGKENAKTLGNLPYTITIKSHGDLKTGEAHVNPLAVPTHGELRTPSTLMTSQGSVSSIGAVSTQRDRGHVIKTVGGAGELRREEVGGTGANLPSGSTPTITNAKQRQPYRMFNPNGSGEMRGDY